MTTVRATLRTLVRASSRARFLAAGAAAGQRGACSCRAMTEAFASAPDSSACRNWLFVLARKTELDADDEFS
jgi:hypothetical protein